VGTTKVHHKSNPRVLAAYLASPTGPVAKDLFRRGKKVESKAKKNLTDRSPRRVDTGRLRSSITTQLLSASGKPIVRVGTNVFYALWIHDGTGIYGPKGTYIYAKRAKYMSWKTKGGKRVYVVKTRGMKPNPFLKDAVMAAKD
jgi:phage gpG-like protein